MKATEKKIFDKVWIFDKQKLQIIESQIVMAEANGKSISFKAKMPYTVEYKATFPIDGSVRADVVGMQAKQTMHLTLEDAQKEKQYSKDRYKHQKTKDVRNAIKHIKSVLDADELEEFRKSVMDVFGQVKQEM